MRAHGVALRELARAASSSLVTKRRATRAPPPWPPPWPRTTRAPRPGLRRGHRVSASSRAAPRSGGTRRARRRPRHAPRRRCAAAARRGAKALRARPVAWRTARGATRRSTARRSATTLSGVEQPQMPATQRRAARGHGEASRGADVRLLIFGSSHGRARRGWTSASHLGSGPSAAGRVSANLPLVQFRLWLMLGIWRLRLGRAPQGGVQPAVDVDVEQRPRRRRRDRIVERFALPALWRFGGRCIARARFPDRPVLAYARQVQHRLQALATRCGARRRRRRRRGRALVKQ